MPARLKVIDGAERVQRTPQSVCSKSISQIPTMGPNGTSHPLSYPGPKPPIISETLINCPAERLNETSDQQAMDVDATKFPCSETTAAENRIQASLPLESTINVDTPSHYTMSKTATCERLGQTNENDFLAKISAMTPASNKILANQTIMGLEIQTVYRAYGKTKATSSAHHLLSSVAVPKTTSDTTPSINSPQEQTQDPQKPTQDPLQLQNKKLQVSIPPHIDLNLKCPFEKCARQKPFNTPVAYRSHVARCKRKYTNSLKNAVGKDKLSSKNTNLHRQQKQSSALEKRSCEVEGCQFFGIAMGEKQLSNHNGQFHREKYVISFMDGFSLVEVVRNKETGKISCPCCGKSYNCKRKLRRHAENCTMAGTLVEQGKRLRQNRVPSLDISSIESEPEGDDTIHSRPKGRKRKLAEFSEDEEEELFERMPKKKGC
ncbi:hypothetical protein BDR26DRAFT_920880 [Obelidium mucronatum]|nr:hypothetical protein BDR26DRAFT_920880 [Obelidium mucronatum]